MTIALKNNGFNVNIKRVYRIMRDNILKFIKFSRRFKGYTSFKGEVGKISENKLNRQSQATSPIENFFELLKQKMYYEKKFPSIVLLEKRITYYIN